MKDKKTAQSRRRQRGQSLVELAISLTVILILLSGAVDFGMAFFSYTALRDAAQEGALYASINGNGTDGTLTTAAAAAIRARVRATSTNPVNLSAFPDSQITITLTNGKKSFCEGTNQPPDDTTNSQPPLTNGVTVTVSYNYPIIMPFVGAILDKQTIPLSASVTDTMLSPVCP
jgi:Flp pilus assembly protein TadG